MSAFVAWILEIPADQLRKCKETNPKCPGRISKKPKKQEMGIKIRSLNVSAQNSYNGTSLSTFSQKHTVVIWVVCSYWR